MAISNNIMFSRSLTLDTLKHSAFLFGPRATGKTHLLRRFENTHKGTHYFDLLDPELELSFRAHPKTFYEQISAIKRGSWAILDEVQRVPALLDYVQMGIEQLGLRFLLSGSSARKLKRGGANLLGGRALDLRIHPLTHQELGTDFHIETALRIGTLPKIYQTWVANDPSSTKGLLKSYVTTYIKEEIQAEALVRKLDSFQRFLEIAAQANAQMIEFQNIGRESSVPMSTVKEFYQILEDTLIGRFVWPFDRSERKKARPRFYFFDCGVVRALQNRLSDPPTPQERGFLFETWFVNELVRLNDYHEKDFRLSLWRKGDWEIDLLIEKGSRPLMGIEIKTGRNVRETPSWREFRKAFPKTPLVVASLDDPRPRLDPSGVEVMPLQQVLARLMKI